MRTISLDFETYYNPKEKYSLKTMIPEQYVRDARFDPYMLSVCDGQTKWAGDPLSFNWDILRGCRVLAHNVRFDSSVVFEMQRRGMLPKDLGIAEWRCTADMSAYLCNRRALAQAVEHLFDVSLSKQVRSDAAGRHWKDFRPPEQAGMIEYAVGDAEWCWKLWDTHNQKWPLWEQRLSQMTIEQGQRGVAIDEDLLTRYLVILQGVKTTIEKILPWIAEKDDPEYDEVPDKPTSTKAIAYECRKAGIPCPPLKSEDEEGFVEWEATYGAANPWISQLSAWRSVNRQLKTFMLMKARLIDGILPFSLKYFGGHTGRWSGDAKINFQNFNRDGLIINDQGLLETNLKRINEALTCRRATKQWPAWVQSVIEPRHLIVPRAGKRMIVSDLSQIEPRVLAYLAGDTEFLTLVAQGQSPYEAFARSKSGWTGGSLKKEDPAGYALAKAQVLGLGYQCGWSKFIGMAMSLAGVDVTEGDPEWIEEEDPLTGTMRKVSGYGFRSKQIVADYRASNPKVADKTSGLWGRLDTAFRNSQGGNFSMELPSGRRMRYDEVRSICRIVQDPDTKKPVKKWEMTANVGGRRHPFYGGKLTENLVQGVARDVFAGHLLALGEQGAGNLFSVHDEAVLEVDNGMTVKDVEATMSICPPWLQGCPIAAEAHEVPHYLK